MDTAAAAGCGSGGAAGELPQAPASSASSGAARRGGDDASISRERIGPLEQGCTSSATGRSWSARRVPSAVAPIGSEPPT
jgi:hypothetical protein